MNPTWRTSSGTGRDFSGRRTTTTVQVHAANLMTLPSDLFPKEAVASVIGIGGTAGAIGGMLMTTYNGYILEIFKSYQPIFIVAGNLIADVLYGVLDPSISYG